jgi:hypothetical protein
MEGNHRGLVSERAVGDRAGAAGYPSVRLAFAERLLLRPRPISRFVHRGVILINGRRTISGDRMQRLQIWWEKFSPMWYEAWLKTNAE